MPGRMSRAGPQPVAGESIPEKGLKGRAISTKATYVLECDTQTYAYLIVASEREKKCGTKSTSMSTTNTA